MLSPTGCYRKVLCEITLSRIILNVTPFIGKSKATKTEVIPMEGGTEKVQEKVAWYKRDKERIRSRFEALYQVYRAGGGDETLPEYDKSDVKEFIKSQPLQGSRLQTLNTIGKICGTMLQPRQMIVELLVDRSQYLKIRNVLFSCPLCE